ncbi:hypothetical protein Aph01nite_08860 [Acrocarpospora phusangensis]|uniref:Beta-lactamase-related domain-containing protein n=1 Tax=Acrocarpospora phusangensis TaxID=1070424 RepID=A0A919UIE0_9ACTN|nr:serine hydrolase domain-containing protein [Acrocarpospora phusangensis]GIH22576.1 hypothetical protein Aph01nite_08860 [Acrocarpospora phusangensis]
MMRGESSVLDHIEHWLRYRQWAENLPGMQVAVWRDGELRRSLAIGHADLAAQTPLTTKHRFRVASHSKTMTAVAVLQLWERDRLGLDDTVTRWIPELGHVASAHEVNVRHLLTHRGGLLRDGRDADYWQFMKSFPDDAQLIDMAAEAFGVTEVDSQYKYSNIGYGLLGLIVARAAGQPYPDYVRTHIADRLGLHDTGADVGPGHVVGNLATGYGGAHLTRRRHRVAQDVHTQALAAATGFYSTAEDLVRIAAALFSDDSRLLGPEARALLVTSQLPMRDPLSDIVSYGYGVRTLEVHGRVLYGHGGNYPGHTSQTLWDPAEGLAVSVLVNAIDVAAVQICKGVMALLSGQDAEGPENGDLHRFGGHFASIWNVLDLAVLDGVLTMIWPGQSNPLDGAIKLTQIGPETFAFPRTGGSFGTGELVEFVFDEHENVRHIRVAGTTYQPVAATTHDFRPPVPAWG